MTPLRVALLTPTFWPTANRLLTAVRGLAEGCQAAGAQVTLVTERLEPDWSARLRFRDWNVLRVERPTARPWGRGRFGKALAKALSDEISSLPGASGSWDAAIVCNWPEALFALEGQVARGIDRLFFWFDRPLPAEVSSGGSTARAWHSALQACQGLLSPHPLAGDWLATSGVAVEQVAWLPERLADHSWSDSEPGASSTGSSREAARRTLAEIHPLLNFERNQLLAVSAAELAGDSGVFDLLTAWRHLRREEPRAQLLLVGDGPQARAVWSRIHDWHLQGNVVMPGNFDDLQELLKAADFYIHPVRSDQSCPCLAEALGSGTPCVLSEASPWAARLVSGSEAWMFPPGNLSLLLECLREAVADARRRATIGKAGAAAIRQACGRAVPLSDWLRADLPASIRERSGAGS